MLNEPDKLVLFSLHFAHDALLLRLIVRLVQQLIQHVNLLLLEGCHNFYILDVHCIDSVRKKRRVCATDKEGSVSTVSPTVPY